MRNRILLFSLMPIALVTLGCGPRCAKPPAIPAPQPIKVITVPGPGVCLTQRYPDPDPATQAALDADAPTPDQVDLIEGYTAGLLKYAARAWRLCGTSTVTP